MNMNMMKQKGFTLVEMMIVIVILGVLAAIAIPKYQDYIEKGDMADMKTMMLKIKQDYEADRLQLPKSYDTKDKTSREINKLITKHMTGSQLIKKYELIAIVANVKENSTALAIGFVATPTDNKRKSVFVDAVGKAYRCKGGVAPTEATLKAKPSNCTEPF